MTSGTPSQDSDLQSAWSWLASKMPPAEKGALFIDSEFVGFREQTMWPLEISLHRHVPGEEPERFYRICDWTKVPWAPHKMIDALIRRNAQPEHSHGIDYWMKSIEYLKQGQHPYEVFGEIKDLLKRHGNGLAVGHFAIRCDFPLLAVNFERLYGIGWKPYSDSTLDTAALFKLPRLYAHRREAGQPVGDLHPSAHPSVLAWGRHLLGKNFKGLKYKLANCCEAYGIEQPSHHDSEADTVACRQVFEKIAEEAGIGSY